MICKQCGDAVPDGTRVIYGIESGDGKLKFGWACSHHPVGDAAVILASDACVLNWLKADDHRKYVDAIGDLFHVGKT